MAAAKEPETNLGVVTSWVPITTAYPSVQGCDQLYWSVVANTVAAWDPGYGLDVADSSCLPRAATTWWDQDRIGRNPETVLSIGPITCPEAYHTAKTSVKDSSSTLVGCCPLYGTTVVPQPIFKTNILALGDTHSPSSLTTEILANASRISMPAKSLPTPQRLTGPGLSLQKPLLPAPLSPVYKSTDGSLPKRQARRLLRAPQPPRLSSRARPLNQAMVSAVEPQLGLPSVFPWVSSDC